MVTLSNPGSTGTGTSPAGNSEVRPLDILFLQDATGSQGPYISSVRSAIKDICEKIAASTSLSKGSIRFGLIAFRDHPPQDTSFVTKNFGFTADVAKIAQNLTNLVASGGGDGPEAQTAALAEALNMEWVESAVKIVVLITDSPPHGLGERGDGFTKSPDQNDPLDIVRQMAERGITLYVIACEPTLSKYKHAVDFYRAICQICSGRMVPLLNASQLGDYIVGSAVEIIETEKLIEEFQGVILEDVYGQGKPIEEVMKNVQERLKERNVRIQSLHVEDIYEHSTEADFNAKVWASSRTLGCARGKTKKVGGARIKNEFSFSSSSTTSCSSGSSTYYSLPGEPSVEAAGHSCGSGSLLGRSSRSRGRVRASAPAATCAQQGVSMATQAVDQAQTEHIVRRSLMRSSKVGPGNVLTPTGEYASRPPTSYFSSASRSSPSQAGA